ncbi:MAG: methyltransferase [Oscillospiraceae bacterium]|jgi:tRNA1Val (adenine37-N6)-methyltransferase|nr:methyltransferase [Oscillospiraceae bacterium]
METLWRGGPEYDTANAFPLGMDSILLADFANAVGARRAIDLGCGAGIIALLLAWNNAALTVDGVEISPDAADTARENMRRNGLDTRVTVVTADLRDGVSVARGAYDLAVANPPYFAVERGSGGASQARSESSCTLAELCAAAAHALRRGGSFALVHRPERLAELFAELQRAGLEPKRLRLAQRDGTSAPNLALVEARRGGGVGLTIEPPLLLTENGRDSDEISRIYRRQIN